MTNRVSAANDDQKRGVDIVRQALRTPCLQIASNAGVDASVIVNKVTEATDESTGYDALNDKFVNMIEAGIIDPTKVSDENACCPQKITTTLIHFTKRR